MRVCMAACTSTFSPTTRRPVIQTTTRPIVTSPRTAVLCLRILLRKFMRVRRVFAHAANKFNWWYRGNMLAIALLAIFAVSLYSIVKAPEELRTKAIIFMIAPPAVGFGLAYFLSGEDTRVYYALAGAIGGWAIGSNIYDSMRKKHLAAKP